MADKERQRNVEKVARKIAGGFFSEHNPSGQLVTVTKVEASSDLSYLTFFVTVLPETNEADDREKLEKRLPQLREEIGNRIEMRRVPELKIAFDRRESSRKKVEQILDQTE